MNWFWFGSITKEHPDIAEHVHRGTVPGNRPQIKELPNFSERVYRILFFVILCVFSFLLFYRVNKIPIPYHVDEAGMVYDAGSLAAHGTDRWGYHFPIYLINYGGGQSALYMYLAAAAISMFGDSVVTVRLPAIMCSLLSAAVFGLLVRRESGRFASLISLGVFCLLPFSIMHSRWGLDAYLLFPMLIFSCAAFYGAVKRGKYGWFVLAGCLFGITLYSYAVSYILVPAFLGVMLVFLLVKGKITGKQIMALLAPVTLLAVPLILLLAVNNGLMEEIRTPYFSVPKLFAYRGSEFSLGNILGNLKPGKGNIFYNIFVWDGLIYNVIPKFGTLYYFTIPLLVLGLFLCMRGCVDDVREGVLSLNLPVCVLFAVSFGIQLLLPYSNVNRACAVYFPLIYFLTVGFVRVFRWNRIAGTVCCGIYALFALTFVRYYFTEFPLELAGELSITEVQDLEQALDYAEEINQDDEPITVYGLSQPYLYTLLVKGIDPKTFREAAEMKEGAVVSIGNYQFDPGEISTNRVYLLRTNGWVPYELREDGFVTENFGTVTVYSGRQ